MDLNLTVGEKIMIARYRRRLDRTQLANEIYLKKKLKKLKFPDGRLKKIETGVITVDNFLDGELEAIAEFLDFPLTFFTDAIADPNQLTIDPAIASYYPEVIKYVQLLNTVTKMDHKLCADIFQKAANYCRDIDEGPAGTQKGMVRHP